ncbi:MAG: bifunctional riboflavin kinase/FAD synthetase [Gemmatimonadetes bacterium]|nr:bifunctional riboflavin kinase/FAD synthetase [Gemmatimonadota bacterium]
MMRTITLEEPIALAHPVVTVGTFDGIHIGHVSVIKAMTDMARACGGTSVVVTFDPHPRQFIDGADASGVLTSLEEKQHCLAALGVDILAVVEFDDALRQMSPEAFVKCFLVDKLSTRSVIIGYDHGFGRGRQGGFETMKRLGKQFGFSVFSPPAVCIAEKPVSSTRIRNALLEGDMDTVVQLLGHPYPLWGRVVEGERRGRALGFPTANLLFETQGKLLPSPGVYAGVARLEQIHIAVVNYGKRPTFGGQSVLCEVHLLNFSQDLYGKILPLEIWYRIRGEREFGSKEALIEQIQADIQSAKDMLSRRHTYGGKFWL